MTSHELYCDERHSERQQCNARAPAGIRASVPIESDAVEVAEPAAMVEPEEEPASSAVREAVAAADVPEPTVYVSREWDRTASAVEANGGDDEGFDVEKSASGGTVRRVAMALAAIAVVLVTARGVRGRRGERV